MKIVELINNKERKFNREIYKLRAEMRIISEQVLSNVENLEKYKKIAQNLLKLCIKLKEDHKVTGEDEPDEDIGSPYTAYPKMRYKTSKISLILIIASCLLLNATMYLVSCALNCIKNTPKNAVMFFRSSNLLLAIGMPLMVLLNITIIVGYFLLMVRRMNQELAEIPSTIITIKPIKEIVEAVTSPNTSEAEGVELSESSSEEEGSLENLITFQPTVETRDEADFKVPRVFKKHPKKSSASAIEEELPIDDVIGESGKQRTARINKIKKLIKKEKWGEAIRSQMEGELILKLEECAAIGLKTKVLQNCCTYRSIMPDDERCEEEYKMLFEHEGEVEELISMAKNFHDKWVLPQLHEGIQEVFRPKEQVEAEQTLETQEQKEEEVLEVD